MRIKIETKIGGVLLIFFIELVIFMYFVAAFNNRYDQNIHRLRKMTEKLQSVRSLQISLLQASMPANDFLIPGGNSRDDQENCMAICAKVESSIKKIENSKFYNADEKTLIKHINKKYMEFEDIASQIFSMPGAIGNIEAGKLMKKMDAIADDVVRDAENFYRFIYSEAERIEAESETAKVLLSLVILIGILVNIIFILGLWFFFKHTISSPITYLRDTALEIAHGDIEKRVDIKLKDEIGELGTVFNYMVDALKASEEDIRQNYQVQEILNTLLKISLEDLSLEEVLKKALVHLTPWSKVMPKGGIFLVEDKPGVLVLKVQQGLSAEIQTICAAVPFGRCLCGKAALSDEIVFSGHIDERHENQYKDMAQHGHYCIPIVSMDKKMLGVIVLYLEEGHQVDDKEKEFLYAVVNILTGIIERKKVEDELKKNEAYLTIILNSLPVGMVIIDSETCVIIEANPAAVKMIGVDKNQIVGKPCYQYICPAEKGKCPVRDLGQDVNGSERVLLKANGDRLQILKAVISIILKGRKYFLESFIDITDRKKAEEGLREAYMKLKEMQDQLIQAEKLNAVGQLASGVAHEVRNPLGIILQGVNYLEKRISGKEEDVSEILIMLKDSVKRADKIINALLDFSRAASLKMEPEDVNSILETSVSLVKTRFNLANIDIKMETKKDMPRVLADKNKLEQVFINMLLNAAQAMPNGGKIIIRSCDKKLEKITNGIGRRENDYFQTGENAVIVEIEDTGSGISEENLKKIFDPFFTTKGPTGGSGLGLSVSRNIVSMHKGLIDIKSQIGKGTTVTIILKIAQR
nr:HAMP domain-containing protein [Candidatus Omnitrophota bacterium]